jgi:NTP pyrophosphatase (non-canonical NTP hydrolase)
MKYDDMKQLLFCTAEECGEVIQACMKIARFGSSDDKYQALLQELGDLQCLINLFVENEIFTQKEIEYNASNKRFKLMKYTPEIIPEDM